MGSAFCVCGFVACFIMAKTSGNLPNWFVTPPISFLGFMYPEHYVYAIAFTSGAICYQIAFFYIQRYSFMAYGMSISSVP